MNTILLKIEKILTSPCARAKKARTLIQVHLVLQAIILVTIFQALHVVFYLAFIFFMLVTVQLIVHIIKIEEKH